jgi:hypothetical protein
MKAAKDDITYLKNLDIFKSFIDEQREVVLSIQGDAKDQKAGKDLPENREENLKNWEDKLNYINVQFEKIGQNLNNPDVMNKPFDATTYKIDLPIYSSKDIEKLEKII